MHEKNESSDSDFDVLLENLQAEILKEEKEIYTERTLKEAYNPKNVGELKKPGGAARVTGPCGDTMQIHLKVKVNAKDDLSDKIVDCKFITDGCGASVACGSVITELVKGKTIEGASMLTPTSILAVLGGLPEENVHCATLAVDTLKAAIANYSHPRNKLQNI
uniref:Iron-sulfur cluster assembly scaffold protein IscU 2 n=1 Tax=Candidatus Methanophagaceae archaeon ANME-1 ERB6 TaxID=2759912 RepID=A0A7G9YXY9_9EURY|nr:iron-sulfur cluster assembly scaffold protein IscU 2 [Methanosarcinales archaeon ANME-1 ERB6]